MFQILIAFPVLALVVILQTTVISQIVLLSGYADLMLIVLAAWALQVESVSAWIWALLGTIFVSIVSEMPWPVVLIGYSSVVYFSQLLKFRIWQAPLLAMFGVIFIGSLLMNILALMILILFGRPLPVGDSISLIILPSMLLNLLFSIPVFIIVRDLSRWIKPAAEVE